MAEERIVEAVFTSANASRMGGPGKGAMAKAIEEAMSRAVTECYSNGITDPDEVREAMMAARADIKKRINEEIAKLAELQAKLAAEG